MFTTRNGVIRARLRQALREEIPAATKSGEVAVDFGCGARPYSGMIRGLGYEMRAFDIDPVDAGVEPIGPDGKLPLPAGSCDLVLSSQVLEHVEVPAAYLEESHRIMKPGGAFVLSTHGHWPYHPHPGDYWRWTKTGLVRIVESAGFEVRLVRGVLGLAATSVQMLQDSAWKRLPRVVRPPVAALTQLTIAGLDLVENRARSGRLDDAAVWIVVAEAVGKPESL